MTKWFWVRHGPTHAKSFVGWRDVPADLSDRAQIERLCATLPKEGHVVSSDLIRAKTTADAIMGKGHSRLPPQPQLREMHFGIWDGMYFEAVSARDPVLSRKFWEEPGAVTAPFGESWNATSARVNAAVDRLNARFPDTTIIAVAHFGVILTQVQRALDVTAYEALSHHIDNLSVTEITWDNGSAAVGKINHLP